MLVRLNHRSIGVHRRVKECRVKGTYKDYLIPLTENEMREARGLVRLEDERGLRYDPYNCMDLDPVGDARDKAAYGHNGALRKSLKRCLELLDHLEGPSR